MNTPTVGRTVAYNHPVEGEETPQQSPAIIQKVNVGGTVKLFVMSVLGDSFSVDNVEQTDGEDTSGKWSFFPEG